MKKMLRAGRVLLALVPFLSIGPVTRAAPLPTWNRVFMSTTGSDSNNCSDPATPCRSFVGAQAQTNAGGEIIAMATGGYGLLTITQSVTINGPAGVVIFSNFPVIVNAPGATVVLRGMTIDGTGQTGHGVSVTSVGSLHVESCVITGWVGTGSLAGDGLHFVSAGQLFVKDTDIRGNQQNGIWVSPTAGTAQASIDNCRLEQNGYGLIADNSNGGVAAKVAIRGSVASGNSYVALLAQVGGVINAEGCLVTNNGTGLETYAASSFLRASNCTVTGNIIGAYSNGGSLYSRGNNTLEGNGTDGGFTGGYSAK